MHKTDEVYYREPYTKQILATVVELHSKGSLFHIILDQTICYPAGGGQPGDQALLGKTAIIDTLRQKDGTIVHVAEQLDCSLSVGQQLPLVLDWAHRYDYMQQHTAQHLISGLLYTEAGIGTVSIHFGENEFTIETASSAVPEETIREVVERANAIIRQDVLIFSTEYQQTEAQNLALRRSIKVEGDVRLISIGEYDQIACGGVHVERTSELLYLLYLGSERVRNHVRLHFSAGQRAVDLIGRNQKIVQQLITLYSAPAEEIVTSTQNLQRELGDTRYQLRQAKEELARHQLAQSVSQSPSVAETPLVLLDVTSEENDYFEHLIEASNAYPELLLCAARARENGQIAWLMLLKGEQAENVGFQVIRERLLPLIEGKGGGRAPLWQGVGKQQVSVEQFLEHFATLIKSELSP